MQAECSNSLIEPPKDKYFSMYDVIVIGARCAGAPVAMLKDVLLSRRRCLQVSALASCSMLLGCRVLAAEEPLSADRIRSIRLPF